MPLGMIVDLFLYIGLGDIFSTLVFTGGCVPSIIFQVHEKPSNLSKRLAPGGYTDVSENKPQSDGF
jgi:hypothetical protein